MDDESLEREVGNYRVYVCVGVCVVVPYSELISLCANFPEWSVLSFSRNSHDLEIHDPNNQKIHMSEISHKVYACT